jgi:hypothetical protein
MRGQVSIVRRTLGPVALIAGLVIGFCGFLAFAENGYGERAVEPAALIGSAAYSADGQEVGTVSAVTVESNGDIREIRLTTASPMGLGERTVAISQGGFVVLDGAVVLDLSAAEVNALPTSPPTRRVGTLA